MCYAIPSKENSNIAVLEAAVWHEDGSLQLHRPASETLSKSTRVAVGDNQLTSAKTLGRALDFSSLLRCAVERFDHVICKMNIEGSEYRVLQEAMDHGVEQLAEVYLMEFHEWARRDGEMSSRDIRHRLRQSSRLYLWG